MHLSAPRAIATTPRVILLGTVILALSGCASVRESRANPLNWFGPSEPVIVRAEGPDGAEVAEPEVNPLIPVRRASIFRDDEAEVYSGTLVAQVSDVQIERAPGFAVLRATGVATSLGAFDARLVPVPAPNDTTLRYELRAKQLSSTRGQGTDVARRITVAVSLTDQTLAFINTIEVVAAQNARSVRR